MIYARALYGISKVNLLFRLLGVRYLLVLDIHRS